SHQPHIMKALKIGICIGLATEILRKLLHSSEAYKKFTSGSKLGYATGFVLDAIILPTPYASSFGGFVDFATSVWFGIGGIVSSYAQTLEDGVRKAAPKTEGDDALPEDMSTNSLVGGGVIAGASLSALVYGIYKLITAVT